MSIWQLLQRLGFGTAGIPYPPVAMDRLLLSGDGVTSGLASGSHSPYNPQLLEISSMDIASLASEHMYTDFLGLGHSDDFIRTYSLSRAKTLLMTGLHFKRTECCFFAKGKAPMSWIRPGSGLGEVITQVIVLRFHSLPEDGITSNWTKAFSRCQLIAAYDISLQISYRRWFLLRQFDVLMQAGTIDISSSEEVLGNWGEIGTLWAWKASELYYALCHFLGKLYDLEGEGHDPSELISQEGRNMIFKPNSPDGPEPCSWDIYKILQSILEDPTALDPFPRGDRRNATICFINQQVCKRYRELLPKELLPDAIPNETYCRSWAACLPTIINATDHGADSTWDYGEILLQSDFHRDPWKVVNESIARETTQWLVPSFWTADEPPQYTP